MRSSVPVVKRDSSEAKYSAAAATCSASPIDKPARAGRATQVAAMVITGLVAFIWVYFGRLYLIHDPDEWRIANCEFSFHIKSDPPLTV
jgi:hypothetical protein